jgi:hypothetical protein
MSWLRLPFSLPEIGRASCLPKADGRYDWQECSWTILNVTQTMLTSVWTKITRSSTPDERKHALIAIILFVCTAWLYFRVAHHLPVVVDMLLPVWWGVALILIMLVVERKLGLKVRRWTDDTGGQPEPNWRDSVFNRHGLYASWFIIFLGFWIGIDHTGRFPDGWAIALFVLGVLGIFLVPCVNALAGVRRSRRAASRQGGKSQ